MKIKLLNKNKHGFYQIKKPPLIKDLNFYYKKKNYSKRNLIKYYEKDAEYYKFFLSLLLKWVKNNTKFKIKNLIDIGCGVGHFLEAGNANKISGLGLDISEEIIKYLKQKNLRAEYYNLNEISEKRSTDLLIVKNLLEHLENPTKIIDKINKDFKYKFLLISTPNDFSKIQKFAMEKHNIKKEYFIDEYHHLNYFNFKSMEQFLKKKKFKILGKFSSFPLEFISVLGLPYLKDRKKFGRQAHLLRVKIEKTINEFDENFMIEFYEMLAKNNLGRELFFLVKK